jgi:DNA-nicking Smr family endonuclease
MCTSVSPWSEGVGLLDVDLHGQTAEFAEERLGHVFVGAVNTNAAGLRVVTGGGLHSSTSQLNLSRF